MPTTRAWAASAARTETAGLIGADTAWTSAAAAITAQSGTITTKTGTVAYKKVGKTVFFDLDITIPANGNGSVGVLAEMPFAALRDPVFVGRNGSGAILIAMIFTGTTTLQLVTATGAYPGADGAVLHVSGCYETT